MPFSCFSPLYGIYMVNQPKAIKLINNLLDCKIFLKNV